MPEITTTMWIWLKGKLGCQLTSVHQHTRSLQQFNENEKKKNRYFFLFLLLLSFHKYNMGQMHYLIWNKSNITSYSILFLLLSFLSRSFARSHSIFYASHPIVCSHSIILSCGECEFEWLCASEYMNTHSFLFFMLFLLLFLSFIWWNDTIGILTLWLDPGEFILPSKESTHFNTFQVQFFLLFVCASVFLAFSIRCLFV